VIGSAAFIAGTLAVLLLERERFEILPPLRPKPGISNHPLRDLERHGTKHDKRLRLELVPIKRGE
jgi:hypothetical protein